MDKGSGTSLALGLGLLITAAVVIDAVFTGRKPWDIVLAVARGESIPKASAASSSSAFAPSASSAGSGPSSGFGVTGKTTGLSGSLASRSKAQLMVSYALAQVGKGYSAADRFGENGSFDCSGLMIMAARAVGIQIGGNSYIQADQGQPVLPDSAHIQAGDLLFFPGDTPRRSLGHVAMAISGTEMVQAANSRVGVIRSAIHFNDLERVRRIV